MPLSWEAGIASEVATDWVAQLEGAIAANGNLKAEYSTKLDHLRLGTAGSPISVSLSKDGVAITQSYDHVFFCYGFGTETATIAKYASTAFWGNQTDRPAWMSNDRRVLIVGAGDGALQDFLLTLTGKNSAREIFEAVIPQYLRPNVHRAVHSAEDQAHRLCLWSANRHHDHLAHRALEQAHDAVIRETLANISVQDALRRMTTRKPLIQIAHSCTHFSRAYALNRFLSLLFVRYAESKGETLRIPNTFVSGVESADSTHACDVKHHYRCHDYKHSISFSEASCDSLAAETRETFVFDGLIVRAGVQPPPEIKTISRSGAEDTLQPLPITRQSLPFYPLD
jgi:hypothetical protein